MWILGLKGLKKIHSTFLLIKSKKRNIFIQTSNIYPDKVNVYNNNNNNNQNCCSLIPHIIHALYMYNHIKSHSLQFIKTIIIIQ